MTLVAVPSAAPTSGNRSFDLLGAFLSTVGIAAAVYAVSDGPVLGWAEPSVLIAGLG